MWPQGHVKERVARWPLGHFSFAASASKAQFDVFHWVVELLSSNAFSQPLLMKSWFLVYPQKGLTGILVYQPFLATKENYLLVGNEVVSQWLIIGEYEIFLALTNSTFMNAIDPEFLPSRNISETFQIRIFTFLHSKMAHYWHCKWFLNLTKGLKLVLISWDKKLNLWNSWLGAIPFWRNSEPLLKIVQFGKGRFTNWN